MDPTSHDLDAFPFDSPGLFVSAGDSNQNSVTLNPNHLRSWRRRGFIAVDDAVGPRGMLRGAMREPQHPSLQSNAS